MQLSLRDFLVFLVAQGFLLLTNFANDGSCSVKRTYMSKECLGLTLPHGKIRTRARSNLIKFQCVFGYELLGQRYSTCSPSGIDSVMPVCIRAGCARLPEIPNGMVMYVRREAAVMYFCLPGFDIQGSTLRYCDGYRWNGTNPSCVRNMKAVPATSCDFESEDLCGWTHDPLHDFDWNRHKQSTPSAQYNTGPSYDHTKGYGNYGYYMYIESTSKTENDKARLISPLLPANLTQSGCFVFFYHMYGKSTGTLRVMVHPRTIELSSIVNDTTLRMKYTMFERSGNQGNFWFKGFFDLDVLEEDFQIVIEGVRGASYASDIAVDDVAIQQAADCARHREELASTTPVAFTGPDSCVNRCYAQDTVTTDGEPVSCECDDECEVTMTCCTDYRDVCLFGVTDQPSTSQAYVDNDTQAAVSKSILERTTMFPLLQSTPEKSSQVSTRSPTQNPSLPPPIPSSLKMSATTPPSVSNTDQKTTKQTSPPTTAKPLIKPTVIPKPPPSTLKPSNNSNTKQSTTKKLVPFIKTNITNTSKLGNSSNSGIVQKLKFATPSPPLMNATGILNKTLPRNIVPTQNINIYKIYKSTEKSVVSMELDKLNSTPVARPNIVVGANSTSTLPTTSTMIVPVSKTFMHYGRKENGREYINDAVLDDGVDEKNILKTQKIVEYDSDAALAGSESSSMKAGIIVGVCFLVLICLMSLGFVLKSGKVRKVLQRGRGRLMRQNSSSSNTDIRFLVHDEELEHEYLEK